MMELFRNNIKLFNSINQLASQTGIFENKGYILPIHICKCYIIDVEKELEYSSILKIFKDPEGNMLYGIIELPVIVGSYFNLSEGEYISLYATLINEDDVIIVFKH